MRKRGLGTALGTALGGAVPQDTETLLRLARAIEAPLVGWRWRLWRLRAWLTRSDGEV